MKTLLASEVEGQVHLEFAGVGDPITAKIVTALLRYRNGESLIPLTRITKHLRSDGYILDGRGASAAIGWDSANRCIHLTALFQGENLFGGVV
jgi:hypothetical protein